MVSLQLLPALFLFAVVTLFTPGPNNVMLMTSGLNFGLRRTIPHVLGVTIGFSVLVAAMGLGLGAVFVSYPILQTVLKYAGAAYLLYLAYAIARSGQTEAGERAGARPMTFIGAALFQWVNVKGWVIALGAITAYAAVAAYPWNVAVQALLLLVTGFFSSLTWAVFGSALQGLVKPPRAVRIFNVGMAALLVASLIPVLWTP